MKQRLITTEDAVTHVIEFTMALTIFVLLIQSFTSAMNYRIGIDLDNNDNRVVMAREVISELTGSQGKINNVTNWEDYEFGTGEAQLRNGITVGLLNSNGNLDKDKCDALGKFPYNPLKNELEVTQELRIEIRTIIPDESVCIWGGDPKDSSISVKSERYMLYNDSSKLLPSVLTVTIFEGNSLGNKIYLTEVMYNPTNNGVDYEWIEVYNPNPTAIYIGNWIIADNVDKDKILPGNDDDLIVLPANKVGILTTSPSVYKSTYGNYTNVFSVEDMAIGNGLGTNETLTLSKGSFEDTFSYTKSDGADGNGKSLTRSCYNCETWNEAIATPNTI
jgi:hypothetical protein|tara:strand:+ start:158 stop:1156 length:999 start_codon:yes stop_codon:yes gene_type:complete